MLRNLCLFHYLFSPTCVGKGILTSMFRENFIDKRSSPLHELTIKADCTVSHILKINYIANEMKTMLFSEQQYFRKWWVWLILIGINGLVLYKGFGSLLYGGSLEYIHPDDVMVAGTILLVTVFILIIHLDTRIYADGIYVRFFPLNLELKKYGWEEISSSYLREYQPIVEYGGWGLRWGPSGKALTISGKQGLQLETADGHRLLIGTRKATEMEQTLEGIGQLSQ